MGKLTASRKRIAFIRMWSSTPAGQSVAQVLDDAFPEYELEILDIVSRLKKCPEILLINLLVVLHIYGRDLLLGRKRFRECFWRTPYIFMRIRRLVAAYLEPRLDQYAFTFQLQSLFDASQPGLPHFVYTDHTHLANLTYPGYDDRRQFSPAWVALERDIYTNASRVFTRSTNISKSIQEQYDCRSEHVVCVYAGSNAAPDRRGILGMHAAADEFEKDNYADRQVLFVGKDWIRKGGPDLVAAFRRVQRIYPQAGLIIVGCTPRLDLPNCQVVGQVPLHEIHRYYEQASLFCLPTRLEPFGIAFIESLTYKLPVVATRIGAIPDFVIEGVNGHLIQPGDIEELAAALLDLLADPEKCRRYGERSFRIANERYTWEHVAARLREQVCQALQLP